MFVLPQRTVAFLINAILLLAASGSSAETQGSIDLDEDEPAATYRVLGQICDVFSQSCVSVSLPLTIAIEAG